METLKGIKVRIREKEVLRLQGYKDEGPRGDVAETLGREIEEGYRLIRPKAIFTRLRIWASISIISVLFVPSSPYFGMRPRDEH
ncbi:MAG: hypothetical protein E3J65_03460 [Dehalococcoidia bacterium]|nr:MAG: hypothetical protein E3J65_03460 [Dehalococcoidia bacterium]